jgi:replicative DNA helicase
MGDNAQSTVTPLVGRDGGEDDGSYRNPPVNYEAEQALLAAILANNMAMEKVSDFLQPEQFADPVHGRIFEACRILIDRGQVANAVTLKNKFEQDGDLTEVGGAQYLAQLQSNYVNIIDAKHYGQLIHDLYLRRQLINLGEDVVNQAFDHDLELPALTQIEGAEQKLYELAETGQTEGGLLGFKVALTTAIDSAAAAFRNEGAVSGVASGLKELDKLLGGLHKSDLVILAGRPSMGKTALATNIAYNVAKASRSHTDSEGNVIDEPQTVAFFSLEMSSEQLAARILSERSGVKSDDMRKGAISHDDFEHVMEASRELERLRLYIDDTPAITIPALRTRARRLKRQQGLSLVVVDYLQLMSATTARGDSRVQEVSEITRGLKAIAKELSVPVLALSQLSRAVEQREDKRPQLADLRESGSIEQDADVVMFVYREQYYLERAEPIPRQDETAEKFDERHQRWKDRCEKAYGLAEVIVAKQRHGPIGTRTLSFKGDTTEFSDYLPDEFLPEQH